MKTTPISFLLMAAPLFSFALEREPLWSSAMPGSAPQVRAGESPEGRAIDAERTTDVARPTLAWFVPADADGRVLIVCPGGGYALLAADKEGEAVGRRMARGGLSVAVLRYRVPCKERESAEAAPRLDLAEAIRVARERMRVRGLPGRGVGVMGFSAGAHLALMSAYGPMPADSARPDFVVAVYPAYLVAPKGGLRSDLAPAKGSPPACFIHAADDPYSAEGSVMLWSRLRGSGVASELHVFSAGGHGFGLSERGVSGPVAPWADLAEAWIRRTAR